MKKQSTDDFQGNENTMNDTMMTDPCHQIHGMYNAKNKL